jgi:AbrB family looped-hinge helix DNA binding protein
METITVTVSNRGYIVLPASLRKELEIRPGSKMLISRDQDRLILKSVPSFTEKLSGLTKQSIADTPAAVDAYINAERGDRAD